MRRVRNEFQKKNFGTRNSIYVYKVDMSEKGCLLEEFDRVMFKSLVRKITVLSNKEIEIEFECGITVRETL